MSQIAELIVDHFSEYSSRENVGATQKLSEMPERIAETICESIGVERYMLGDIKVLIIKNLYLDEEDTPTIEYDLYFPKLNNYIMGITALCLDHWHYYIRDLGGNKFV
ncbi:hypothetical protein IEN91_04985 [Bacillus velezensis]|uniref:hypothetical protein n=1 Tax=Bacillus velezensis TaxID=492670 RepID=UPI0018C5AF1A|nr:hypothetical protein [Bacillus velezensis]QPK89797.1 hypothetical protein IEN91_04985 [Bacillus velezensis]